MKLFRPAHLDLNTPRRYLCVHEKLFEETVIFILSFFVTSKSNLDDSIVNTTYLKSSTVFLRTKRIEQLQMKDPGTEVSYRY